MWAAVGRSRKYLPKRDSFLSARHLLDQLDDAAAQLRVGDAHESLDEREPVVGREEVRDVGRRRRFVEAGRAPRRRRRTLEEERDRHLQDERDLLQAARADAIGALLVFLNLL